MFVGQNEFYSIYHYNKHRSSSEIYLCEIKMMKELRKLIFFFIDLTLFYKDFCWSLVVTYGIYMHEDSWFGLLVKRKLFTQEDWWLCSGNDCNTNAIFPYVVAKIWTILRVFAESSTFQIWMFYKVIFPISGDNYVPKSDTIIC